MDSYFIFTFCAFNWISCMHMYVQSGPESKPVLI